MDDRVRCSLPSVDWNRAELLFAHPNLPSYASAIETCVASGERRFCLHGGGDTGLRDAVASLIASTFGPDVECVDDSQADAVHVHFGTDAEACSALLMRYVDRPSRVIAPRTAHHASNRSLFMVAIPKSGFHLVSRVLSDMGIAHGGKFAGSPVPHCWQTLYYDHPHLPANELFARLSADERGGTESIVFRQPVVFCYRHPADIVISEARYYAERDATALAHYFNALPFDRRLLELIADTGVVGTLRDRVASYREWMELPNVIPIAFEEIVGEAGGGSDVLQLATIWAMQMKLHVAGRPQEFARHLFGERNQTFRRGQIGGFQEVFKPSHVEAIRSMPRTDFLDNFGYRFDMDDPASVLPSRSAELRRRPLTFASTESHAVDGESLEFSLTDETLYQWHGYYVGVVRGRYCAIEPGQPRFDPFRDEPEARWFLTSSAESLAQLLANSPLADQPVPTLIADPAFEEVFRSRLVVHLIDPDVNQHSLSKVGRRYVGTPHSYGELDLGEIDPTMLQNVIVGTDLDDVIVRIRSVQLPPRLVVGSFHGHNIVEYRGVFYGIPVSLGAVDLQSKEDRDNPAIPRDPDLECLKAILAGSHQAEADDGLPHLVREGYYGFNILRFHGTYHAIPQVAGAVDLLLRPPESIPGSRSAATREALERRLTEDLIAPSTPCPAFAPDDPSGVAEALRWVIHRLEVQAERATRSEIGIGSLQAEVALLRRTLERLLSADKPGPPPQASGIEEA